MRHIVGYAYGRRRRNGEAGRRVDDIGRRSVHGQKQLCRFGSIGSVRHRVRRGTAAEADREGNDRRIDHRVEGHAKRRCAGRGLEAKFDEVCGVRTIDRRRRIRVRSAVECERFCVEFVAAGVGCAYGAMIVVEKILIDVLAAAIRTRAAYENRRRDPDARIDELRCASHRRIQDRGAWARIHVRRGCTARTPGRARRQRRRGRRTHAGGRRAGSRGGGRDATRLARRSTDRRPARAPRESRPRQHEQS